MEIKDLLLIVLPILSAVCTFIVTVKTKKSEAMLKFKEEKYTNLLILLQGFIGNTVSAGTKKKFFEEQYKSWLYSSDGVVKAINRMVDYVIAHNGKDPDPATGRKIVGNIVLEMRKDMVGRTRLNSGEFKYTDVIG